MAIRRKKHESPMDAAGGDRQLSVKVEAEAIAHLNKRLVVYALQGGGALGAYQVGAYQALLEHGLDPDWVTGISIGSLNAAIIAGNERDQRVPRLRQFWEAITRRQEPWDRVSNPFSNFTTAFQFAQTCMFGLPNFFRPWAMPPMLSHPGSSAATSYYNTAPLRETLQELVDFGVIARGDCRLTLGSTKIFGGELKFFDSTESTLRMDHVLASGSYPPSFPSIEIDGYGYWDGGVVANTSVSYLADHILDAAKDHSGILVICINLWQTFDPEPRTLDEVMWRTKQIQFSSRVEADMRELQATLRARSKEVTGKAIDLDVLIVGYQSTSEDVPFGDGDFSYSSIVRRIERGRADMRHALEYMCNVAISGEDANRSQYHVI